MAAVLRSYARSSAAASPNYRLVFVVWLKLFLQRIGNVLLFLLKPLDIFFGK